MNIKSAFLVPLISLLSLVPSVAAAPDGCSSADFRVARSFDSSLSTFPISSYAAADFNGDGKPDLAVTASSGNNVAVLLNDGTGGFDAAKKYPVGASASAVTAGDFNGDGHTDLAVANSESSNISVLLGTGSGLFGSATNVGVGSGPRGITAGDINGDGKLDLAVANVGNNNNGSVSVLLGNGAGSFANVPGSPFAIAGSAVAVAIADFDSNLKPDLVVGSFGGFFVIMADGSGGFNAPVEIYDPSGTAVAASDVNGDGKADLVMGSRGLVIRLGDGAGGFSAPTVYRHESNANIISVAVADIDGDGHKDVAAVSESPGGFSFFKGNGTGAFITTRSYLPASNLTAIALADFEGDGDLDVAGGSSILVNVGAGAFEAARAVYPLMDTTGNTIFGPPSDIALGDFNADGRSDMAVIHSQLSRASILLRDASGNFNFASAIGFFGATLNSLVAADFNEDGKTDVAVAGTTINFQHVVWISLNNGDGTFAAATIFTIFVQPSDMVTADFNSDGNLDLFISGQNGTTRFLYGNGGGGFNVLFGPTPGNSLSRIDVGDLNGDSTPDLALTDYHGKRVVTFSPDSIGTLQQFNLQASPRAIAIGDFNLDGKRDIAIVSDAATGSPSDSEGSVSVLLGNGTGGFAPEVVYPVGIQPVALVIADFNGDGKPDLAVANSTLSSISVLTGDGTGIFRAPQHFPIWGAPRELAVDDFDADGKPDIAVTLFGPQTIGLLFGKVPTSEPCVFADDAAITEGDTTTTDVTVRLSAVSGQVVKVNYVLTGNPAAIEGQDFTGASGTLTFQPGETSKTVTVTIFNDTLDEGTESFKLNLTNSRNARISDGVARISITDNDPPPTVSINDISVTESDSTSNTATFTVSLSAPTTYAVTLSYVTANGTATSGVDFDQAQGGLVFGPGEISKTINVNVRGDRIHEPDETFLVNLSNPVDATIADGQGQGTILNNDPLPTFEVFGGSGTEGNGVDIVRDVTVRISNPSSTPITLDYATADSGSATAGSDYIATSGTLTLAPGETQKTFQITIKDDASDEAPETFFINYSNPVNATLPTSQVSFTIIDNDGPSVSINDVSITEGQFGLSFASFTLSLSAASPEMVFVQAATVAGTAFSPSDFRSFISRTVAIPAGSTSGTITVTIVGDMAIEPNETFSVNLSQPQGCTVADGQGIGTILNDDITSVEFSTNPMTVNEADGIALVTVLRVGDSSQPFTAFYGTFNGIASERSDYNAAIGWLQFAPGETSKTIPVFITNDVFVEDSESFNIILSGLNGAPVNTPFAEIIINDDDAGGAPNPINASSFFVRQHYRDFLGRDPDASGLAFWTDQIESCGADLGCREVRRINVSAAFFLSIEFQETGYLVYRTYKSAFGDTTSPNVAGTVPVIRLSEFLSDSQRVGQGVQVGIGNWQQKLEDNKNAYLLEFVERARFLTAYPTSMTAQEFVAKLDLSAGAVLSAEEQAQLVAILGATPSDPLKRAEVLRKVAEDADLNQKEFNRAFVLMQFYGYLRRNPNDFPDSNFGGWKFWLDKLNEFNGNFIRAEMVNGFLVSTEYRGRFGN